MFKRLKLTYDFNEAEQPLGELTLGQKALDTLSAFPDHHIAFAYLVNEDGTYTVVGASLILNTNFRATIKENE